MTGPQTQDWRTTNIHALVQLACCPDPHTYPDRAWVRPVRMAVRSVRADVVSAYYRGEHGVCVSTLDSWSVQLTSALQKASRADPARWRCWFVPGSWLELNVRLSVVLAALSAEARAATEAEDAARAAEIAFADMRVPERLGWPAWAVPVPNPG